VRHLRRQSADIRKTVVVEVLLVVPAFMVAFGTKALVIVHKVLAAAWIACFFWTIGDVPTDARAICFNPLFEAAVALACIVILVDAGRLRVVDTSPMSTAQVSLAIVNVFASRVCGKFSCRLASSTKRGWTIQHAIGAVTRIATEAGLVTKHEFSRTLFLQTLFRHHYGATLYRHASIVSFVGAISLA
jgi:hypothetical protein